MRHTLNYSNDPSGNKAKSRGNIFGRAIILPTILRLVRDQNSLSSWCEIVDFKLQYYVICCNIAV